MMVIIIVSEKYYYIHFWDTYVVKLETLVERAYTDFSSGSKGKKMGKGHNKGYNTSQIFYFLL